MSKFAFLFVGISEMLTNLQSFLIFEVLDFSGDHVLDNISLLLHDSLPFYMSPLRDVRELLCKLQLSNGLLVSV